MSYLLVVTFFSCGDVKTEAVEPASIFVKQLALDASEECPNGGVDIEYGIDRDLNGILDGDEVQQTFVVCHGENGTTGDKGDKGDPGVQGLPGISPTGSIVMFAGDTAPPGWALCDGAEVSRINEATLFAVISVFYGDGDGTTTFNLPDLRGRSAIGAGQGTGLSDRVLGNAVGSETQTLSVAQLPSHVHTGTTGAGNSMSYRTVNSVGTDTHADHIGGWNATNSFFDRTDANYPMSLHTHNFMTHSTGGSAPHPIMPPSIVLNYIIKL